MTSRSTEFLAGDSTLPKLSEFLKRSSRADLAVAYWGAGAIKALGIDGMPGKVRILCDAYSGACSLEELSTLLHMKNVEIKTRNDLHAKVWIFSASLMFVGSANASANGLGQEGVEARNIEAGVLVREPASINNARRWFRSVWGDARDVTPQIVREVRSAWQDRRCGRPSRGANLSSILKVLLADPGWFKDREIRIIAAEYVEPSKAASSKFYAIAASLYHPRVLQEYKATFYEDNGKWRVSEGEYVIDYDIDERQRRAIYQGIWRIRSADAFHSAGPHLRVILCDEVRNFKGLKLGLSDANLLGRLVFRYVSGNNFKRDQARSLLNAPLDKAAQMLGLESQSVTLRAGANAGNEA